MNGDGQAPFCPSCGAPQIRVNVTQREQPAEHAGQGTEASPPASPMPAVPPPIPGFPSATLPGRIQWGKFFRVVWPLALISGLVTGLLPPVGALLVLPTCVIVGLRLYRKHHPGAIRTGQGARMGAALALLSFPLFALLFSVYVAQHHSALQQEMVQRVTEASAGNPDPQARQLMLSLVSSHEGFLLLMAISMLFSLIFLCIFAALAGALAATFAHERR